MQYSIIEANTVHNPTDMHLVVSDDAFEAYIDGNGPLVPSGQFELLEDAIRFRRTMNQRARREQTNG